MGLPSADAGVNGPEGKKLIERKSNIQLSHLTAGHELVFRDVSVTIANDKQILKNVNGSAAAGEMLAIMGPSGAGKTTLLNAIAGRLPVDNGSLVTLNGKSVTKQVRRKISYVLQTDTFLPDLSFWDTVWFTALLRLPQSMPMSEKRKRVNEIIAALDMEKCHDTIIGDGNQRGLSGGEKKRTNIACELLTNPSLMLLDEPTSGLDSTTAYSLIYTLKEFAKISGKTVVATIHQPSSKIFQLFDKVLLIHDGQVAYFGEVDKCEDYFTDLHLPCPSGYNIADHILDVVKEGTPKVRQRVFDKAMNLQEQRLDTIREENPSAHFSIEAENGVAASVNVTYAKTPNDDNVKFDNIQTPVSSDLNSIDSDDLEMAKYHKEYEAKWPTGFWLQFAVLTKRCFKQAFPCVFSAPQILQTFIISLFVGVIWFQTIPEEIYLIDRLGAITMMMMEYGFNSIYFGCTLSGPGERAVIHKERLAGYYRLSAYYLAKIVSEVPLLLVRPLIGTTITYWMVGLNNSFLVFLQITAIILLSSATGHGIGMIYVTLFIDFDMAITLAMSTMVMCMMTGGFFIQFYPFWLTWLKYFSFIRYIFSSILTVDLLNIDISCATNRSRYCDNLTNSSKTNAIIPRSVLLDDLTLAGEGWQMWHSIAALILMNIVIRIAIYILLRFIRKPHSS